MTAQPARLGLMPPMTGVVGIYGAEISHAGQIACEEVNENGGVLGCPLELVIQDDGSLPESAVAAAKRLVDEHRCHALVGNLLSNSRIAVAYEVAEPRGLPYLNFSFYEGSILGHCFFHFAALPNQQIDRMIPYMRSHFGPRMFFAGNSYEWPRGSIDAAKRALQQEGGETVAEEYLPLGASAEGIECLLEQVAASKADVFVPYFAGSDQIRVLSRFSEKGLKNRMALVMGHYDEVMASLLSPQARAGLHSCNTYFMTLDTPANQAYLARLARRPGVSGIWPQGNGILTHFGEGTYLCVKAFAAAANQCGSLDPEALIEALQTIVVSGPQGTVRMDPLTHHAQVNSYLARCQADGRFTIVESFGAIPPLLPERYRHLRIGGAIGREDVYLQSRMMAQIAEAVLLVRAADGAIVYANPGAERMFGITEQGWATKRFPDLFAPSGTSPGQVPQAISDTLVRKGVWQGEAEHLAQDGKRFWCASSMSVFTHPKHGEAWLMLATDIGERKRAEEVLRQSEERFRTLVTATAQIIWTTTADGRVVTDMPAWRAYTGQTLADIQDYGWLQALHPDDRERTRLVWERAVAERRLYDTEYRIRRYDGEYRWFAARGAPVLDAAGTVREWIGTCTDVHARKQAEAQARELTATLERRVEQRTAQLEATNTELLRNRALIEAVREAQAHFISAKESQATFDGMLVALCRLTGSEYGFIDELVKTADGQPALTVRAITNIAWNEETRAMYPKFLSGGLMFTNMKSLFGAVITSGAPVIANDAPHDPRRAGLPPGHPPLRAFLGLPIRAGDTLIGVVGLANRPGGYDEALIAELEPITQTCSHLIVAFQNQARRQEAEDALRHSNAMLAERTAQLETANKDLESFSYSVSHDLRVPLRAIDGFSQKLEKLYAEQLGDEGRRLLTVVRGSAQRMGTLIDDVLAFSRMGRREMERRAVDMTALVQEAATELAPLHAGRALELRIAPLPGARGDAAMLRQVWINLLSNAIKFTRTRPTAQIEVGAREDDTELVYWVRDNGVGFDMQYVNKLFGVFQRLHSPEEFEGTGTGLAIVKRIVTRHGGRVWAEGKVNEGATFWFALRKEGPPLASRPQGQ